MEAIIRRRLIGDAELCTLLAALGNEPAIFYAKTADDVAMQVNYPQIVFTTDKFNDAAYGLMGTLNVEIISSQETTKPEVIARLVKRNLENVLFRSDAPFVLRWQKSEPFVEQNAERTPLIIGLMMTFEIYELPCGVTAAPDPIQAMQVWAQRWDDWVVVGLTDFGEFYVPTRERPAVWFSAVSIKMDRQMMMSVFVDADINAHIFAPDVCSRREWATALSHALMFVKAVPLADGSPMRLQTCEQRFDASEIQGQVKIGFEYGLRERKVYEHPLNKLQTEHGGKLRRYDGYLRR